MLLTQYSLFTCPIVPLSVRTCQAVFVVPQIIRVAFALVHACKHVIHPLKGCPNGCLLVYNNGVSVMNGLLVISFFSFVQFSQLGLIAVLGRQQWNYVTNRTIDHITIPFIGNYRVGIVASSSHIRK